MKTRLLAFTLALLFLAALHGPAQAASYDLTFGGAYAAAAQAQGSTTEAYLGAASWYKTTPVSPVVELYMDPYTQFGGGFTIGDIARITYRTLNDGTNPSGVDYFIKLYTEPYVGGDASWYGNRLNAEPLYSNSYAPAANVWVDWNTDVGTNQLTFFDANHCDNFGFYNAATLADLTGGPVTWSTYAGAGAGADTTPIDYASQPVKYVVFGTGSGWASFTGYLDAIEIELTNGDIYTVDLEDFVNEVWVDDDWAGTGVGVEVEPGKFFGHNAFATIQDGVDNVFGSTVHVAAGTYEEQVVIDGKDVLIDGAGVGLTVIQSPVNLTDFYMTGSNSNYPVVFAKNSGDIRIQNLTVDGLGRGNANYRFQGVGFWEAGGALLNCEVLNIADTPFSGAQHGVAVYCYSLSGGPFALEVGGVDVSGFQKNAFSLSGAGMTLDVHDCTMVGAGPTTVTAQNGLQIGFGAGGTVRDCSIADVYYSPASVVASGLLVYAGTSVDVQGGLVITDCQAPIYWLDAGGSIDGATVTGGGDFDGATLYNSSTSLAPGVQGLAEAPVRGVPSPFEDAYTPQASGGLMDAAASISIPVTNSCFTGSGTPGSWGIGAYSGGGPMTVTVNNCTITGYDTGMAAVGAATTLTANDNSLAGNPVAGYDNTNSGAVQDATQNWWGAADGPSGDGGGSGGAVLSVGGEVDFDPWRVSGASSTACAFTQGSNVVTPIPDDSCVSTANPCATFSFDIARSDNVPMRGFSVTFQLSPELELCTGSLGDIVEGTYLNSVGATNMQVLDLGGGTYTVDVAILGIPCGADAPTGTLFTVDVTYSGTDGVGSATVNSVIMRDCVNVPIAADAGAVGTITADGTSPAAMTDLAAAQLKTGNDSDGTTKTQITFTAPVDAASVEVFRKGFGDYPEYDDLSGAVPTIPATPGAALGDGWASTPVANSGDYDEALTRDFWYFVAFVTDSCGNVSAVSNMTDGTLGYHLGDVTNGVTPGIGENMVNIDDISALGAAYGTVDGNPNYKNFIDVGPTTDFFVDALPTTDNQIQFEDLMMFAINFGQVSKPGGPAAADRNAITAYVPGTPGVGGEFAVTLELASNGSVKGVSVPLTWNASVVEPIGFVPGELLDRQVGQGVALSPKAGTVDATVFGANLIGEGELASIRFRVVGSGDPAIALGDVTARDADNRPIALEGATMSEDPRGGVTPVVTRLLPNAPNPFRAGTTVFFTLAEPGAVKVQVVGLDGRLVRTLIDSDLPKGERNVVWDGRDDLGREVAAGSYVIRLQTPDLRSSQRVVRLK